MYMEYTWPEVGRSASLHKDRQEKKMNIEIPVDYSHLFIHSHLW